MQYFSFYKDAPCGAGKTYSAIQEVSKSAKLGKKSLILSPTCELVGQSYDTANNITSGKVPVFKFHGKDGDSKSPVSRLNDLIHDGRDDGCIAFATHQAFFRLPHPSEHWDIILDEAPALDRFFNMHMPRSHNLLTDMVDVVNYNSTLYEVIPENIDGLRGYAQNIDRDEIWSYFSNIAQAILSDHFKVFVNKEDWHRTLNADTEKGKYQLTMVGLVQPTVLEGWGNTTMLGAFLRDSAVFKYWSREHNVQWQGNKRIKLRYDEHVGSDRIEMLAFYNGDRVWSRTLGNKAPDGEEKSSKWFVFDKAREMFGDGTFAVLCNKSDEDGVRARGGKACVVLPQYSYGLNTFSHIDNFVSIGAFHVSPSHRQMLATWGLTPEDTFMSTHLTAVYQALCRVSVRDPNSDRRVRVILPDLRTCEILNGYFKEARIGLIGEDLQIRYSNPKKRWDNHAKQTEAWRERQALLEVERQQADNRASAFYMEMKQRNFCDPEICDDSLNIHKGIVTKNRITNHWLDPFESSGDYLLGTFYLNKYKKGNAVIASVKDEAAAIAWMEDMWQDSYLDEKEQNILICPSLFKTEVGRTRDNVDFANALFLDVDGGDLPESDLAKIFPDIKMTTHNTWSSRDRTKFRAWIPVSRPISATEYQLLMKQIIQKIQVDGYLSPKAKKVALDRNYKNKDMPCHGIDLSKQAAENLMFLPCQAGIQGGISFFMKYIDERETLDVDLWLKHTKVESDLSPKEEYEQTIVEVKPQSPVIASPKLQQVRQKLSTQINSIDVKLKQAEHDIFSASGGTGHEEGLKVYTRMYKLVKNGLIDKATVDMALDPAFMGRGGDISKRRTELKAIKKSAWEYKK